jgi:hypothetical protein
MIPLNEGESSMDVANFSSIPKEINYLFAMEFISKYLMYNFYLVKSNYKGRIHIMSKLRFQVIPVIISGSLWSVEVEF